MSENTGVDPQGLTLPRGGGGVADMGASFNTDLNTGTGSYSLSLSVPAGPNGIAPHLSLRYQSGAGNGPFGIGWSFGAISIARKTDAGIPTYAGHSDVFLMPGVDDLVDVGNDRYRPRVDTLFYRIRRSGDGWEVTDTRGTVHVLGATAQARIESTTSGFTRTACWLLESTTDSDGNAIHYTYQSDGPARQVKSVQWGSYRLDLVYEDRPDKLLDCRYGFVLPTNVRCARVELHVTDVAPTLVKSWNLGYAQAPSSGLSLLTSMTLRGHAADGSTLDAPATTLGYRRAQPPTLARLSGIWPGLEPAAFSDGKVELVDWNGDGLPDVFELRAGRARVWPNLGRGRFGVPESLPSLPSPLDLDQPGVAFADMLGNGTSCLVTLGNSAAGYTPIQERGGFGLPVRFQRAPRAAPGTARFVDLDGDGVTDLLATGDAFFALYYRTRGSASSWSEVPQTIPRHQAPPVELGDPHVRLADMNGDSLHDLVRFDGAGVTWWPYLGYGTWADPIAMANPPRLPRGFDPRRLFVVDVDGDGCADFVYVDAGSVTVWFNQGGRRCADPIVVDYTPAVDIADVRLVDLDGTGTIGVLWSNVPIGPVQRGHVYLDLSGGTKPYLLDHIDNGIGLQTTIAYRPSTEYAIDAAERRDPWQTFHPFPVQCVASLTVADATTGQTTTTRYLYHAARYDSANKSFLGFQVVDSITDGDASIPGQRIRNTYHLGVDPADPTRKLDGDELIRFGALRRRLVRTEVYGLDGSAEQDRPYRVVSHAYDVRIDTAPSGARIGVGYETHSLEETWERETAVFGTREMLYDPPDDHGNLPSQRMRAQRTGVVTPDLDVRSVMTFAVNTAAHIVSLPARVTQLDAAGRVLSAKVIHYDGDAFEGLPEGQADKGFVTRTDVLAFTDDMIPALYGASPPDLAALGYRRRTGETGWWITQSAYHRELAGGQLTLITRGPRGFDSRARYDASRQYAVELTDALGNVTAAEIDRRTLEAQALTDGNGATTRDRFDALGRVTATVAGSDTPALPSVGYEYDLTARPYTCKTRYRVQPGAAPTVDELEYYDGRGQKIAGVVPGEGDAGRQYIVQGASVLNPRGLAARRCDPHYATTAAWLPPSSGLAATTLRYDALGRVLEKRESSGAIKRFHYEAGRVTTRDSFDGGSITRVEVQDIDVLGRVLSVSKPIEGRTARATYEYNALNHITRSVDPDGGATALSYDLLGRLLVDEHGDTGRTVMVVDAAGNLVERRTASGNRLIHTFDALDRMVTARGSDAAAPDATYTYLNAGDPAPPDGVNNRRGRLWRIDDAVGSWTKSYDLRGQVIQQTRTVVDFPGRSFATDFVLDGLGRQIQTTFPELVPGGGRRVVSYTYGPRGTMVSSPGYVRSAEYDVQGRVTRLVYQNHVDCKWQFLPGSARLDKLSVTGGAGQVLRDHSYGYDGAGNTASIASPLPLEQASFTYDDFDRLTAAHYGSGESFGYRYSDGGTVAHVDGIGDLGPRAPGSGQITSAGAGSYSYDADGRIKTAPYGSLHYDALDRLRGIDLGGGKSESYEYDFNGLRAVKRGADGKTSYVVDASVEIVDGKAVLWITFAGRRVLGLIEDRPLYVHGDALGNPTLFSDASGAEARRIGFGPYGTVRFDSAAGAIEGARFANQWIDDASGLVCMGRRYYDPRIGRFLSADILIAGAYTLDGWNRYAFARNNPLRYVDPTGMLSVGDVFAIIGIVIVIAALCVAAYFTGGISLTLIPGLTASLSAVLVTTAIGVAGGAIIGGIAAAQAGGDIWKGILFGGFVGGVSAFIGGYLGGAVTTALTGGAGVAHLGIGGGALVGAIQGSIVGAGSGAAIGFAGGKGTIEDVLKHMLAGFITGAITGAALGAFSGLINGENGNAVFKIGTLDKYTGAAGNISTANNALQLPQNVGDLVNGSPMGLGGSFASLGSGSQAWTLSNIFNVAGNGALITIPVGWVPSALVSYGGIVAVEDISMTLDATGVASFSKQLVLALGLVPFVGILFGYGLLKDSTWEQKAEDWLDKGLSQGSSSVI